MEVTTKRRKLKWKRSNYTYTSQSMIVVVNSLVDNIVNDIVDVVVMIIVQLPPIYECNTNR